MKNDNVNAIKAWLTENRKTQAWLADRLGITRQSVYAWTKGTTRPDVDNATRVSELTGLPLEAILATDRAESTPIPHPDPPGPTHGQLNLRLPVELLDRLRRYVFWTPSATIVQVAEEALDSYLSDLESQDVLLPTGIKRAGDPWPPRPGE